MKLLP
jgi:hypothetical protein